MTDQYVDVNTSTYNDIVSRTRKEHRLLSAHWEITYRCNERCTHCYLDVLPPGSKLPGELTTEEAKGVIDDLANLGALTISFSGGEVFLRRDIFEITGYARKKGFAVRFFTNGILIKPAIADKIAAIKPVVVELSVYGADAETHDGITHVPGSFDLTIRAIKLLLERNVRCIIKTPIMKENIHQVDDMKKLAEDLGISFQYDLTLIPKHTGDLSPLKHRPTDDQLLGFLRERISPETWHLYPQSDEFRFCSIGMNSLDIGPYGEIYTCVGARVTAGNVRQTPLRDIWLESPVWEETSSLNLANLPVCSTCELRQFCIRCHGTAAFEDGDMLGCSSVAYREARLRRQAYMEKQPVNGV
ncbi:MAG: radical SAM protein [Candidatus Promineifilaceae bacterium]